MSFAEFKTEALRLSPKYRASLAKELLASLDALSEAEVERLWIEESIRRDDEIDKGVAKLRSAEEVFARARSRRR